MIERLEIASRYVAKNYMTRPDQGMAREILAQEKNTQVTSPSVHVSLLCLHFGIEDADSKNGKHSSGIQWYSSDLLTFLGNKSWLLVGPLCYSSRSLHLLPALFPTSIALVAAIGLQSNHLGSLGKGRSKSKNVQMETKMRKPEVSKGPAFLDVFF